MTLLLLVLVGACFACQWLSSQTLQLRVQGAHIVAKECWTEVLCCVWQFNLYCFVCACTVWSQRRLSNTALLVNHSFLLDGPSCKCLLRYAMICYAGVPAVTSLKARFVAGRSLNCFIVCSCDTHNSQQDDATMSVRVCCVVCVLCWCALAVSCVGVVLSNTCFLALLCTW